MTEPDVTNSAAPEFPAGTAGPDSPSRRPRLALWGVLAVLVVAIAAVVATRNPSDPSLQPLPLSLGAGGGAEAALAADAMFALPVTYVAGDGLPLLGGTGPVYRLDPPSDDRLRALAASLGVDGQIDQVDGSRRVVDGSVELSVYGTNWSFFSHDGGGVVSSDVGFSCPEPGPGEKPIPCEPPERPLEPERPANLPTEAEARAAALAALDAAGFETEGAIVQTYDVSTAWSVDVRFLVDGHPVSGYTAYLTVGGDAAIIDGGGTIGELTHLGDYPIVDTRAAIERLNANGGFGGGIGGPVPLGAPDDSVSSEPAVVPEPLPADDVPTDFVPTGDCAVQPDGREICAAAEPRPAIDCDLVGGDAVECTGLPEDPILVDPLPVEPIDEPFVEPEPMVITLDTADVAATLMGSWDGSETFVVPAYTFAGTDSGGFAVTDVTVMAIDDALLSPPEQVGDPDVPVEPPTPGPTPDPCVLSDGDATATTHTIVVSGCDGSTDPGIPAPGDVSGDADILLHCGDIVDFDGRWWHTDADVSAWNDVTEGGTLTIDPTDPDVATFVGDAQGVKTATFRAGGPSAEYPGCD